MSRAREMLTRVYAENEWKHNDQHTHLDIDILNWLFTRRSRLGVQHSVFLCTRSVPRCVHKVTRISSFARRASSRSFRIVNSRNAIRRSLRDAIIIHEHTETSALRDFFEYCVNRRVWCDISKRRDISNFRQRYSPTIFTNGISQSSRDGNRAGNRIFMSCINVLYFHAFSHIFRRGRLYSFLFLLS